MRRRVQIETKKIRDKIIRDDEDLTSSSLSRLGRWRAGVRPEAFLFAAIVYTNNRWIFVKGYMDKRRSTVFLSSSYLALPPPLPIVS
jgi:hypothetical protein